MTSGALIFGLLNGLSIGFIAVGLVLVYKSNRFLNLAQGQLGAVSALLTAKFVLDWNWNWWLAFIAAIGVGVLTALVVERFLIAPIRRTGASPVRLLLMSVAITLLLQGLTFVPHLGPSSAPSGGYPQPFDSNLRVAGVTLTGMFVLTAVLIPAVVLVLTGFLRFSVIGKAIRAAANNPDAARLCGVSVAKMSAITWAVAGGLSAVSAVLQAPQQPSFNIAALGPKLLMLSLGAAAFGAFISIPWALIGGVFLGVVGQWVLATSANGSTGELAQFGLILLIVLVRGKSIAEAFALSGGVMESTPVLRVPPELRRSPLVTHQGLWLGTGGLFVAAVLPRLPYFERVENQFLLVLVVCYALISVGVTMLTGWAGQVSLGNFAIVGLAAYLTARWAPHWSLVSIVIVTGVIGALVMVIIGLPALRVGGMALAVTSTGLAVVSANWLYRQRWVGSEETFTDVDPLRLGPGLGTSDSQLSTYYIALALLTLAAASAVAIRRLGPGRVVIAVRDNEPAASSFGINPPRVKLTILALTGFMSAGAGVVWAGTWGVVSTQQFAPELSVLVVVPAVIGGLGSISGAITGAVLLYASQFFIGPHFSGLFGSYGQSIGFALFLGGTSMAGALLYYPQGIAGLTRDRWQRYLEKRAPLVEQWSSPSRRNEAEAPGVGAAVPEALAAPAPAADVPAQEPVLAVRDVAVRFGGIIALDGAAIEVRPGEIVGLIGPNGAGKTTLMNVISGFLQPDRGSVQVCGHEVSNLRPDARAAFGLARTFQDARLFGGLTVTETVQTATARQRVVGVLSAAVAAPWARATEERSRIRAKRIIDRFGLTYWEDSLTSELSTGTRRICDLAAQVATQPRLLLLDEPTAGVAQREAEAFGPLLRRIVADLGCSVLIVEHDMPLLMGLCDRVYAMDAGRVIADGTPAEVRNDPAVVASYLGTSRTAVDRSGAARTSDSDDDRRRRSAVGAAPMGAAASNGPRVGDPTRVDQRS